MVWYGWYGTRECGILGYGDDWEGGKRRQGTEALSQVLGVKEGRMSRLLSNSNLLELRVFGVRG